MYTVSNGIQCAYLFKLFVHRCVYEVVVDIEIIEKHSEQCNEMDRVNVTNQVLNHRRTSTTPAGQDADDNADDLWTV